MKTIEKLNLKNGLRIITAFNPNVESVTFQLRGKAGSNYETETEIGCAHLLEHSMLFSNKSIIDKISNSGGYSLGVTSKDDVLFMVKTLKKHQSEPIELFSNILNKYDVSENILNIQRKMISNEISGFKNNLEKYLLRYSYKGLFKNQRISFLNTGELGDIEKIDNFSLNNFYKKHYNPANFVISVAGNFIKSKLKSDVIKLLDTKNPKGPESAYKLILNNDVSVNIFDHGREKQVLVSIDFYSEPISEKASFVNNLIAEIIHHKLNETFRNKLGLVYKIGCANFASSGFGKFTINLISNTKDLYEALSLVAYEVKETFSLPENKILSLMNNAKTRINADLLFNLEKTSFQAEYLSFAHLHNSFVKNPIEETKLIDSLTKKDILEQFILIFNQNPKYTIFSKNKIDKNKIKKVKFI